MTEFQYAGRVLVYGAARMGTDQLPPDCRDRIFDVMAIPIQKHLVRAANLQIRKTKDLLGLPGAKGLLWVASDGNTDLRPDIVWYLIRKKS